MPVYYNEHDAAAAAILRELIARDVIAPGDVDERSIREVEPSDLAGYTQCHFFAGGGLWSVAARLAGWPDNRRLWTGSCPCQPFSAAGKGLGKDDPRHLWPDFHRLIRAARPAVVMGEQVAGAAGYGWFDGVSADLAQEDYASRCVDIPVCAIDGPHQRNRLYWIAVDDGERARLEGQCRDVGRSEGWPYSTGPIAETDGGLLPDADRKGRLQRQGTFGNKRQRSSDRDAQLQSDVGRDLRRSGPGVPVHGKISSNTYGRNGSWWADAEWIVSPLDGKARRAKPGIPFLVDGLPGRVDLWRVGGNAISPILAAEVIAAFLETESLTP